MTSRRTVALVGAGLIGQSWAAVFASHGWTARLYDNSPSAREAAPGHVRAALQLLHDNGLGASPEVAMANVQVAESLEAAVEGAELVQESLPEAVEIKTRIFDQLDRLTTPDTILASSTSAVVASLFTRDLAGRHRCLVAHPVNPPHLIPLVELCPAPWTSNEVVERARRIYSDVGKSPILVKKEVEGFVLNRLQGALMTEAFRMAAEGVASPEDIDKAVSEGLGARWAFMGPFETIELNAPDGMVDYARRYGPFYRRLADDPPGSAYWSEEAMQKIANSKGDSTKAKATRSWRDMCLAAIAVSRRSMPQK